MKKSKFYEFFSGGGMARAGLSEHWECIFANDIDEKKGQAYKNNWKADHLIIDDIKNIKTNQLPEAAELSWASFPCQDLSLAGNGEGLNAGRSGTFWDYWSIMKALNQEKRAPNLIVLENVTGALTSHNGDDFRSIIRALNSEGYIVGAMVIDAALFLPQSRPRLFIVGVKKQLKMPSGLVHDNPVTPWHTKSMITAVNGLSAKEKQQWRWFTLPIPPDRSISLSDIIENKPQSITWNSQDNTEKLLRMMTDVHLRKIDEAKVLSIRTKKAVAGTLYKRTRNGVQRVEVRFDGISGCLRTPKGGSSRQTVVVVNGGNVATRLISARETARLMGLDEDYQLPEKYNDAYSLTGDGVVVSVVKYLASHVLNPIVHLN